VTLFVPREIVQKRRRSQLRDRKRPIRIATGIPRLMESTTDRRERVIDETWDAFVDMIRRSASARIELLASLRARARVSCPWQRLGACDESCRCGGAGEVTVGFLRDHYARLVLDLSTWRSS
jgi:hypothetical protein